MSRHFADRSFSRVSCLLAAALLCLVGQPAAAAGFTGDVRVTVDGAYTGANDIGVPTVQLRANGLVRLSDGVGTGQADKVFADARTLSASATEDLDLAGSLTDPLGVALTFAKVKCVVVIADAANTNNVQIGGASSNTFVGPFADASDIISIKPGGVFSSCHGGAGWTVTAATGDLLKVANSGSGTGVTFKLIILGSSS